MTKNNQCKNSIDLSKLFVLGFQMQVGTCFRARDADLKTKTRPMTRTLKPDVVIQSRPLGSCNRESLKKLESGSLQMFCKIGSIKNFAIFTGKHLC